MPATVRDRNEKGRSITSQLKWVWEHADVRGGRDGRVTPATSPFELILQVLKRDVHMARASVDLTRDMKENLNTLRQDIIIIQRLTDNNNNSLTSSRPGHRPSRTDECHN